MRQHKLQTEWSIIGKVVLVVSVAFLFSILFLYLPKVLSESGNAKEKDSASGKEFERQLAGVVQAVQPSSGQTVAFKSCRVVKPKVGGFRLGAFNVLEIDELEIILPCAPVETAGTGSSSAGRVTESLRHNLDAGRLASVAGLDRRVSMVSVKGFRLFMLDGNQQRIPVLTARTAKSSGTASVSLEDCELLTEQLRRVLVPKAKLGMSEPALIEAAGQRVNLDSLAAVLKNKTK